LLDHGSADIIELKRSTAEWDEKPLTGAKAKTKASSNNASPPTLALKHLS
jgi:hypothetical protein